jgi:hypothetical protein
MSAEHSLESAIAYLERHRAQYGLDILRGELLRAGYPPTVVAVAAERSQRAVQANYYNSRINQTANRERFSTSGCISSLLITIGIGVTAGAVVLVAIGLVLNLILNGNLTADITWGVILGTLAIYFGLFSVVWWAIYKLMKSRAGEAISEL